MQWEAICRAKKKGCKFYNFGGISPIGQAPNPKSQILNNNQISNSKSKNENLVIENSMKNENLPAGRQGLKLKIDQTHAWSGITRFKLGFAPEGKYLHYPSAFDIIYQPALYWAYKFIKKFK